MRLSPDDGRPLRIYLADDDDDLRALVVATLRQDGHEVVEARDGHELLELLERSVTSPITRPDLVVTDVLMPGFSGIGILSALRRTGLRIPVILMTALRQPRFTESAFVLGATAVFQKPLDLDDLRTAVLNARSSGRLVAASPVDDG